MTLRNQTELEVSVIIPCISISDGLLTLVKSIKDQIEVNIKDITVVVKDLSLNELSSIRSEVNFLKQKGNGRAEAINLGARESRGNIFVFIDDDCLPTTEKWLMKLTRSFAESSDFEIASGRVIVPDTSFIQAFIRWMNGVGTPDYGTKDFSVSTHFCGFPGTNLAVRKLTYQNIGGFDENLIVGEDLDFCVRAFKKKIKMKYSSDAVVSHRHRRDFFSLIKHAWKSGKGSRGFIKKYGFINNFLKGTSICVLLTIITPLLVYLLWLSSQAQFQIIGIALMLVILYSSLSLDLIKTKKFSVRNFFFPPVLALYGFVLGLGFLYQSICNGFAVLFKKESAASNTPFAEDP